MRCFSSNTNKAFTLKKWNRGCSSLYKKLSWALVTCILQILLSVHWPQWAVQPLVTLLCRFRYNVNFCGSISLEFNYFYQTYLEYIHQFPNRGKREGGWVENRKFGPLEISVLHIPLVFPTNMWKKTRGCWGIAQMRHTSFHVLNFQISRIFLGPL